MPIMYSDGFDLDDDLPCGDPDCPNCRADLADDSEPSSKLRRVVRDDIDDYTGDNDEIEFIGAMVDVPVKYLGGTVWDEERKEWLTVSPIVGFVALHFNNHVVLDIGIFSDHPQFLGWVSLDDVEVINLVRPEKPVWV